MRKLLLAISIALATIVTPATYAKAQQNLVTGEKLDVNACIADFYTCANIAESANILKVMYRHKQNTDQQAGENAKKILSEPGVGWDKGYNRDKIDVVSVDWKALGIPLVDAQAIIARKEVEVSKGGPLKKYYMISLRGTEQLQDWLTNARAIKSENFTENTKVAVGFYDYADEIANTDQFKQLVKEIQASELNKENYEVLVTGHSLGGAASVILKAILENKLPNSKERIQAITFGAPPVGDSEFAKQYGNRVIGVKIAGDPVPSLGAKLTWQAEQVGKIYEFERPDDIKKLNEKLTERNRQLGQDIRGLNIINFYQNIVGGIADIVTTPTGIDSHVTGYTEDQRYIAAQQNGWYDLRNQLMQQQLQAITQGGSSHIGSAAYYLGRSPREDSVGTSNAVKVQQFSGAITPSIQQKAEFIDRNDFILKAPVDVVLDWNQTIAAGQLDLDSHLTGPTSLGADSPVRFHIRYDERGSLTSAPYALLYRDVIPAAGGSGPEQTRIQVLQDGVYRFYVHNYTNRETVNDPALSGSSATVTFFNNGKDLPDNPGQNLGTAVGGAIEVPRDQLGNVWYVFQLDTRTGILKRVNLPFGNESDRANVPRVGER
ncbi:hypothetical protein GTQ43_03535 [Nostoc sp. KVJ3]|uniref:lipase family protein n=1 Tax=Nostoc sp. KVJ3 TaxID=457945 RepID=UPI0022381948|nr:lipase family protein [Nostoc sp. KVJ3]MCW5312953.1 hypothetical protein [Nostoc sp. KVJ3]